MELQIINKLYLELSQIATAKTELELELTCKIAEALQMALNLCWTIERVPASPEQTEISVAACMLREFLDSTLNLAERRQKNTVY